MPEPQKTTMIKARPATRDRLMLFMYRHALPSLDIAINNALDAAEVDLNKKIDELILSHDGDFEDYASEAREKIPELAIGDYDIKPYIERRVAVLIKQGKLEDTKKEPKKAKKKSGGSV